MNSLIILLKNKKVIRVIIYYLLMFIVVLSLPKINGNDLSKEFTTLNMGIETCKIFLYIFVEMIFVMFVSNRYLGIIDMIVLAVLITCKVNLNSNIAMSLPLAFLASFSIGFRLLFLLEGVYDFE